jgi:heme/copper-type cytochrome/quinol oxidase subunit 3
MLEIFNDALRNPDTFPHAVLIMVSAVVFTCAFMAYVVRAMKFGEWKPTSRKNTIVKWAGLVIPTIIFAAGLLNLFGNTDAEPDATWFVISMASMTWAFAAWMGVLAARLGWKGRY